MSRSFERVTSTLPFRRSVSTWVNGDDATAVAAAECTGRFVTMLSAAEFRHGKRYPKACVGFTMILDHRILIRHMVKYARFIGLMPSMCRKHLLRGGILPSLFASIDALFRNSCTTNFFSLMQSVW